MSLTPNSLVTLKFELTDRQTDALTPEKNVIIKAQIALVSYNIENYKTVATQ